MSLAQFASAGAQEKIDLIGCLLGHANVWLLYNLPKTKNGKRVTGLTELISNPNIRSMLQARNIPAAHSPRYLDTPNAWPQWLAAARFSLLRRFVLRERLFSKYANICNSSTRGGDCLSGVLAVRHTVVRCKLGFRESEYRP